MSHTKRPQFLSRVKPRDDARLLVLFCHPRRHKSRVNRVLLEAIEEIPGVTAHDLYEAYPDGHIDVEYEQALLLAHPTIVMQHPFYWYSTPPLLKLWLDVVLTWGWAYGKGGVALKGKNLLQVITTGGGESAYQHGGFNRFTIRELLAPMDQTAWLCGMNYLPPFVVHGTHALDQQRIVSHIEDYRAVIRALIDGRRPDPERVSPYINSTISWTIGPVAVSHPRDPEEAQ